VVSTDIAGLCDNIAFNGTIRFDTDIAGSIRNGLINGNPFIQKNITASPRILLFFFEGNDFERVKDREKNMSAWRLFLKRYRNLFRIR
jgi:hypothetical protein